MDDCGRPAGTCGSPAEDFAEGTAKKPEAERKGMFTSGIVATREGHRIALFFSGHQHAGENLKDVLARRAADLPPPIQMCDALSRNLPGELKTILANCLAHGRRQFVDVAERFPEECRHVLESLAVVYHNDAIARERNLSPEERLLFHQAESGPTMEELHAWLTRQFDQRLRPSSRVISFRRARHPSRQGTFSARDAALSSWRTLAGKDTTGNWRSVQRENG